MSDKTKTISLRVPLVLVKKLIDAATKERRTLTSEIVLRLEQGFEAEKK